MPTGCDSAAARLGLSIINHQSAIRNLTVVGAGLAGCEAVWQAAVRGIEVRLLEMRPGRRSGAHRTDRFGELVCSNSLRSDDPLTAIGSLKRELRELGSLVMRIADATRVPAGRSLAVDRDAFAARLTEAIGDHPRITVARGEVAAVPDEPAIVASGPLTSDALAEDLARLVGAGHLHFYDAIAPIVDAATLAPGSWFAQSRYDGGDDYLNVPLTAEEYAGLIADLTAAAAGVHAAGERQFFEGCLPIEEMARRGADTPRFGPMKPVGLADPATGHEPFAVIQLRREDLAGRLYNLVGFQTQLAIPDQERILRRLPAFRAAGFVRHGSAHRNTFLDSPRALTADLSLRRRPGVRVAGQLAGVEGYVESAACGLAAGLFAANPALAPPPATTVIGGLLKYITATTASPFQPMKANWGVVEELPAKRSIKKERLAERSLAAIQAWREGL